METSTSTNSNTNTTDNQESSTSTITEDRADSSLDSKAGGDIKIYEDPPAIITGTPQTEPVSDNTKSDNPENDDNLCKEKATGGGEEKKMETSTSSNSNANTDTDNQELTNSTVAGDHADLNLDTKAGGDIKVCVDPPAIITGTSQTELVSDNTKSDSSDDNLCKEKTTGGGDNPSDRSITPSGSKNDMCDSPDFNLFNKTQNFLSVPLSITGTSTPATDSSEMLEEDMVLKWDDDDEENDKFEEGKSAEQEPNLKSNMEDNEITVNEKQIEKSSDFESKVDDERTDEYIKKISTTEMKNREELLIENDGVTVNQENKEVPKITSVENLEKIIDDESVSKQNTNPTYDIDTDQNEMKLTDSFKTATNTKEILKDDNFENEENKDAGETEEDKDTTSIDNIITNLDQMIDVNDVPVNKENVDSSLSTKTDQIQINLSDSAELKLSTKKLIPDIENVESAEDTEMEVNKVATSICNVNTNPDQMTESEQKEDSSLDAKSDKELVELKVKSCSEELFKDTENESKSEKCIQTSIEQITTCVDNTNLNIMIERNEGKPINVDKIETSIQENPDSNSPNYNMDTDNCNKTVSKHQIVEISDTKTINKSIDLGEHSEVQKISSPIETEHTSVEEACKIDSHDSENNGVMKEKCADIIFPAKSMSVSENSFKLDMSPSNSFLDATLEEKEHHLIKPNMMTDIPSQSMIDFDDSLNFSHNESIDAKYQGDSVQKPKEQIAEIGDSQKKDDVSEETLNKSEILKNNSEIKDTIIQDLNLNEDKESKQTSVDNKTELSIAIKETDLDKTETEVTKQIDSDKLPTESSEKINDSSVEIKDETEPTVDPVTSLKTTETTDQTKDQTFQEDASVVEPKASSSQMDPDTSDEVPEVTDSLGLLAESFRVMEDDEEQETSDHDDGDDEEDFDQDDESSNQMTTEQDSNDSNTAQQSETDAPKDAPITQADVQTELDIDTDNAQDFEKIAAIDDVAEIEMEDIQLDSNIETEVTDKDGEGDVDIEEDMVIDEVDIAATTADGVEPPEHSVMDLESAIAEAAEELDKVDVVEEPEKPGASDIETVKLSDSSDLEEDAPKKQSTNILKTLLETSADGSAVVPDKSSPAKTKKLEISKQKPPLNFVDLEESSSEDEPPTDVQEVPKEPGDDVTTVNIPNEIEIMSVGGNTSDIVTKDKEVVISGVPKPPPVKPARLNTSEVTIKSTTATEPTPHLVIPEVKGDKSGDKAKFGLEVFNLDSDEEEPVPAKVPTPPPEPAPSEPQEPKPQDRRNKCINDACPSDSSAIHAPAPRAARAMYAPHHTKKAQICELCAQAVVDRSKSLVSDIRSLTPLLQLDMGHHRQELVEISDSDSEGEGEAEEEEKVTIGWKGAAMLDHLTEMINDSWQKFKMDARLTEAENALKIEQEFQENELKELGAILDGCQVATDKLRNELYATFEPQKKELPALIVFDTPDNMYSFVVPPQLDTEKNTSGPNKRRLSTVADTPNKKVAIPLGFPGNDAKTDTVPEPKTPLSSTPSAVVPDDKNDDDKDISVVKLSAEAAPASLPPPGEPARPRAHAGMQVYAMRNAFGSWLRAKVVECTLKGTAPSAAQFSQCRVKFESKTHKNAFKTLPARCLAYSEPSEVRMTIGTRIIALFKEKDKEEPPKRESYYSGIVAEVPNPVNNFRYLVFFDDGYAQYVQHADTRLVCEFSSLVWEEVHPFSREFVRQYLLAYPERPMVRLHPGQSLKTEWNGKWWSCKVIQVDASLVHVHFEKDNRTEWIYRGSTRLAPLYLELQAAERHRARPLPRNRLANQSNMPYVEYTRSEEQTAAAAAEKPASIHTQVQAQEELRRQRAVAKKSTTAPPAPPAAAAAAAAAAEAVTSRVVYYTPKNAVKPHKMAAHTCSPKCKRSDVLSLKELRTYNPLAKPLLSGWERQIVRFKGHKEVMYRAPCGRRIRDMKELHRYLRTTKSEMSVDLFDFACTTHCLAEFVLNRCIVSKKDLSNGKENVPVPCVNYYDDSLPEFCSYNTERTPTEGVPLNLDPDFLCGCDCTDDCEDKSKCACWKLTLEGARTIGLDGDVGYEYRRLPEPLPSGIYECNSRCKCKQTCLNRVAQHPLQLKLQVFKTINRGWGIRALNDVPKGAFLCVYAGNLLTDATANLDGLNEGDEYLAELDYIEVVEQMKEGYEEDIPEADKKLDKESGQTSSSEEASSSDDEQSRSEQNDGDFEPGFIGLGLQDFSKRLRKRDRSKKKGGSGPPGGGGGAGGAGGGGEGGGEDCITISDDEELREPARFAARPGMGAEFVSKYRSVRSYFGKDEACYIMDAKVQGNIGRYLNHSCSPNVFVQNVFVDTHDPRFPWVAFFALRAVRAGTELTWNYNYDVGSVPGKVLYCHCGAANCRGRLL